MTSFNIYIYIFTNTLKSWSNWPVFVVVSFGITILQTTLKQNSTKLFSNTHVTWCQICEFVETWTVNGKKRWMSYDYLVEINCDESRVNQRPLQRLNSAFISFTAASIEQHSNLNSMYMVMAANLSASTLPLRSFIWNKSDLYFPKWPSIMQSV